MRHWLIAASVVIAIGAAILFIELRPLNVTEGKFPEELVYVRTVDGIVDGGARFAPPKNARKPVAVIWIHGWGVNFYQPTYVMIGRNLAARGYTTIAGNTRMHDLGNVLGERFGKRIRGGGYWGVASDEVRDLGAWIDFAERVGFKHVVLVGHSAGWAAVREYMAERQDPRVVGIVLASGTVDPQTGPIDRQQLAEARQMMAAGRPDDLVRLPNRPFPSFVSAATFLDIANEPPQLNDFFGMRSANAGVTRITCPLLAFYGTRGDVGREGDLQRLRSALARLPHHPALETAIIRNGDHMYTGEEAQVAQTIASWADRLPLVGR